MSSIEVEEKNDMRSIASAESGVSIDTTLSKISSVSSLNTEVLNMKPTKGTVEGVENVEAINRQKKKKMGKITPGGYRVDDSGRLIKYDMTYYENGSSYEGECYNSRRFGFGRFWEADGTRYDGDWLHDRKEGYGEQDYPPPKDQGPLAMKKDWSTFRRRYEGDWHEGFRHGLGIMWEADGSVYKGEFARDHYEGYGRLLTKEGDTYEGEFYNDKLGGKGKILYKNGDIYEGMLNEGSFWGKGTYRFAPLERGAYYQGEFQRGVFMGQGTRVYIDGTRYDGNFYLGELDGSGVMHYSNGAEYIGEWRKGKPHGRGIFIFAHGDRYEGDFVDGNFYGRGKYTYADGSYYDGEYRATIDKYKHGIIFPAPNGKRHGVGTRCWVNGVIYKGTFVDDLMHGKGSMTKPGGGSYEGTFVNGKKHGPGKETWGNRRGVKYTCQLGFVHDGVGYCEYTGNFVHGVIQGQGKMLCGDGRLYKGNWKDGCRHGKGLQILIPTTHRGDKKRFHYGGVGACYRYFSYEGNWDMNIKSGWGIISYSNGDTISGQFTNGHIHGRATYSYNSPSFDSNPEPVGDGKKRIGIWERGIRKKWITTSFTDPEGRWINPNDPELEPQLKQLMEFSEIDEKSKVIWIPGTRKPREQLKVFERSKTITFDDEEDKKRNQSTNEEGPQAES